jgi:membrane protein
MRVQSFLSKFRLFAGSFKNLYEDDCLTQSSSISFVFLLSIIPFAMLNIFIFNLIQRIAFPDFTLTENIRDFFAKEIVRFIPIISEEWIKNRLVYSKKALASFRIINFILLPIVSSLLFKTLETSYRKIFRLPGRHLIFSQGLYALLAIFLALLLFITSFTWSIVSPPLMRMVSIFDKIEYFTNISQFLANTPLVPRINFLSVLLIFIFYFVTVRIFLNIKIKKVYVFLSGLVFCLLWIIAREIFQWYVENISKVNLVYGSLSSIIIILLWIYYSSVALLYSIEFLHLLHTKNT